LSTTGAPPQVGGGNTLLERIDAIEAELQRLTSKTEELEFRINRITVDGTNRIGDLEFRLCEVEPGCDIGALGDTPSLGGVDSAAGVPLPQPAPDPTGPALALGEQSDFDLARAAFEESDFQGAADKFTTFVQTYPGGPLSSEAYYLRGEALEGLGQPSLIGADELRVSGPVSFEEGVVIEGSVSFVNETTETKIVAAGTYRDQEIKWSE
jgi:TolA-binding protein